MLDNDYIRDMIYSTVDVYKKGLEEGEKIGYAEGYKKGLEEASKIAKDVLKGDKNGPFKAMREV